MSRTLVSMLACAGLVAALAAPGGLAAARVRPTSAPHGTFQMAFATDFGTLDPASLADLQSTIPMQAIYDTLVTYAEKSTAIVPDLATWTVSPDGRTYTFHLRPHVRFSNGDPLTAADVKFSLDRETSWDATGPDGPAPLGGTYADVVGYAQWFNGGKKPPASVTGLSGVTTPNASTIVIRLTTVQPYFLDELAEESAAIVDPAVVNRCGPTQYLLHAVGTGPYELESWARNKSLTLVPNPYYTGPTPPRLAKIVLDVNVPASTQFLLFKEGKVDMIFQPDAGTYLSVLGDPALHKDYLSAATNAILYLPLNTQQKPFNNRLVRLAVNEAIDRTQILRLVNGRGSVMTQVIAPHMPGYVPSLRGYRYDPAQARKLLAEAGYPHGLSVTMVYSSGRTNYQPVALNVQAQLAKVGIHVTLHNIAQTSVFFGYEANPKNPWQIGLYDWYQDYPDPADFFFYMLDKSNIGAFNIAAWTTPKFEALISKADTLPAADDAERWRLYDEAQQIWFQDAPWVPLYYPSIDALVQPWVGPKNVNVFLHPVQTLNLRYVTVSAH